MWLIPASSCHFLSSEVFDRSCRRKALRVSSLRSAFTGLLCHDQAPPYTQWGHTLPVHGVPGVLQQPGCHAEARQEPRGTGIPPRVDHQQHLPIQLQHLNQSSPQPKIKRVWCCCCSFSTTEYFQRLNHLLSKITVITVPNSVSSTQTAVYLLKTDIHSKLCMKCSQVMYVSEPCVRPVKPTFVVVLLLLLRGLVDVHLRGVSLAPPCGQMAQHFCSMSEMAPRTPRNAIIFYFNQVFFKLEK